METAKQEGSVFNSSKCTIKKEAINFFGSKCTRSDIYSDPSKYWSYRDNIGLSHGILFTGSQVIVPKSLRNDILGQLHLGHMGIEIYLCDSNPCRNGATCKEERSGFTCQCPFGFTGVICEGRVPIAPPAAPTTNTTSTTTLVTSPYNSATTYSENQSDSSEDTTRVSSTSKLRTRMEHNSTFAGEHTAITPTAATNNTTTTTSTGVTSPNTSAPIVSDNDDQSDVREDTTLMSSTANMGGLYLEWNVSVMTPSAVQFECVCTANYSRQDGSNYPNFVRDVHLCSGDQINFGSAFDSLILQSGCVCPDALFIESHCDPASAYQIKVKAITTDHHFILVGTTNFTTMDTDEMMTLTEGTHAHDGQGDLCVMNVSSSIKVITSNNISECECRQVTHQYSCGNIIQNVCADGPQNGYHVESIRSETTYLLNHIVCECRSPIVEYCNVLEDMAEDPCKRNPCLNGGSCSDINWCKCYGDDCNVNPTGQSTITKAMSGNLTNTTAIDTTKAYVHLAPTSSSNNAVNMAIISSATGSLSIMCGILVLCLHLYFKRRRRQDDRRAENKIIERMSSAHFENPAYQIDKAAGDIVPPPIRPRPITSLPVGSGDLDSIYTEYIYVDQATPSPSERGSTAKDLLGNGEYIYVVEPFAQTHCGSDEGPLWPLPTAPPPPAGEYIYFDQCTSPKTRSGTGNRYVLDPTDKNCPGKGEAPSAPSKLGSQMEPELPRPNIQPSPLKASAELSNMSAGSDDVDSGNECIYEELPEMSEDEIVVIRTCPSMSVGSVNADVDGDLYLLPCV
ncbi:uncharacterized protein LOC129266289 [Lytechinus pictus]|uniref:uncharacterized protein LOC129266289 n=1 Tax=Lytechinus pictus TaxID=7653 RepID=UPI0030BA06B8